MSEIKFESKGEKLYVVKLDDTAIGRLLKNKEGSWKISLGILEDQDLYTLLNSLNKEPCESGASLFGKTMKCTYRFKNPDIGTAMNVLCGKNYVQEAIREQYDNNNETIDFEFQSAPGKSGAWGCISVSKSEIERVRAYDPDDWNPFPEVNPPECGEYLVTFKDEDADYVQQNYFDMLGRWGTAHSDVIAFRALPAPYQPETNK